MSGPRKNEFSIKLCALLRAHAPDRPFVLIVGSSGDEPGDMWSNISPVDQEYLIRHALRECIAEVVAHHLTNLATIDSP